MDILYTYSSAWYLTRIRLPYKNKVIEFKYESEGLNCYRLNYYPIKQYDLRRYEDRSRQVPNLENPDCEDGWEQAGFPEPIKPNNLLLIYKTNAIIIGTTVRRWASCF